MNGRTASLGESADPERDVVSVDGVRVAAERPEYWLVHKPAGVITTARDPQGRPTVVGLAPEAGARVFPVGRLDRDTEGLVLLTNDGALTQVLLHPSHETEREYVVTVQGRVDPETLRRLERGIPLEEAVTAPARAGRPAWNARDATTRFALTLVEGRKRQIRRSLARLGHPVVRLVRVRMGPLRLGRLPPGAARRLRPEEVGALRRLREAGETGKQPAGPGRKARKRRPIGRSRSSKPPSG